MSELGNVLRKLQIPEADEKEKILVSYMNLVLERNRQVNLTAITEPDEFIHRHYADSLSCAQLAEFQAARTVIDVGTGGGFPGVPLAVAFPEKEFVLLDSLNKRIRIIREFCEELGIGNVTALHGRAEELARQKDLREQFDVCVSRAVADMRVLAEYCLPFVKTGGCLIAYKGPDCEQEIKAAENAIRRLGGSRAEILSPALLSSGAETLDHRLIQIIKEKKTPDEYPRRAGQPAKKPL